MSAVTFNGYDLSKLIKVHWDIDPEILPAVDDRTTTVGDRNGSLFLHRRIGERVITMGYTMLNADEAKRQELTRALNVSEPKQLILGKQPDRYYMAMPKGDISRGTKGWNDWSTIDWIVYEPYAHSLATQTADNKPYKDVPVNLLTDSGFESGNVPANYAWGDGKLLDRGLRVCGEAETLPSPMSKFMLQVGNYSSDSTLQQDQYAYYPITPVIIKNGETWTYSYYYATAGSATGQASDYLMLDDINPLFALSMGHDARNNSGGQTTWHRFVKTWTADRDVTVTALRFGFIKTSASPGWLCIDNIKLAKEHTASPWSPNPAEPEYYSETITLTNNGTVPTPLHVTAEMRSDNGFLGLTLDDNPPYQVGNPDEIDGVMYDPSQMLVPDMPALAEYAINDAKYQVIPPSQGVMKQQGSLQQTSDKHISAKDFGPTPSVKGPRGPAMIYALPADNEGNKGAKNWTFRVHDGFGSLRNKPRDVGQICATVLDINGKSIASIIMADLSQTGNEFLLRFDVNQKQVRLQRMTWKDWDGSGFTTHYYIRKSGNQFTFGWARDPKSYTYVCDELADTEAYYVSFSFLKWMDVPTPAYYGLVNWNFRKDMVDEFKNLPNYFTDGDLVNLDSKTNTLTINDYPDWDRVDIASEPLLLQPGKSTLGIVYSTFAKPPKVTVDFEERWL